MIHKRSASMFYSFLVHEGALFQYIANIRTGWSWRKFTTIETVCDTLHAYQYIKEAFDWIESPEGYSFWGDVNKKWQIGLEKDRDHFKQINIHKKFNRK